MSFKDHFSGHADDYAAYRPCYPSELFAWLAQQTQFHDLVWDCACGNGQAARGIADFYDRVVATDASTQQINAGQPYGNITYEVMPAEKSNLKAASVDLLTVAQALHWFDRGAFYREARRVLKDDGVLAVWTYGVPLLDHGPLQSVLDHYYSEVVGAYWPPERVIVEKGYRDLPFPFLEMTVPEFAMDAHWDLARFLSYVSTWSATKRYLTSTGVDPLPDLGQQLQAHWEHASPQRRILWPMSFRVGRKAGSD